MKQQVYEEALKAIVAQSDATASKSMSLLKAAAEGDRDAREALAALYAHDFAVVDGIARKALNRG